MSLCGLPRKVRIKLEKIQRNLLWGDFGERTKMHLLSWSKVCKDKKFGGLGFKSLEVFNQALLGKWLWRFVVEWESLWRRVIQGKFRELEGGWCTHGV